MRNMRSFPFIIKVSEDLLGCEQVSTVGLAARPLDPALAPRAQCLAGTGSQPVSSGSDDPPLKLCARFSYCPPSRGCGFWSLTSTAACTSAVSGPCAHQRLAPPNSCSLGQKAAERGLAPPLALDVSQDLAQSQPTQLKGLLDSEDGDLLLPCGKPLLRCLWRGKEVNVVAERHPDLLDRFQPILGRLWDHDGNDGAFGLVARHALRRDGQPDDLSGGRAPGRDKGGLLEHHGEKQGVPRAPRGKPYAIDGKAVGMLVL